MPEMGMRMCGNGNGNNSIGMGRELEQESHCRTPLLSAPVFHRSVWCVITAHKLTADKRGLNTVVSDQRSRFTAPSIN